MHFSELLNSIRVENNDCILDVPEDWRQGRTLFGGVQAALGLKAMRALLPDLPLRTLQTTFIAPIKGKSVRAQANKLRSGKFTTHIEVRLRDGNDDIAIMIGIFGTPRPSEVCYVPQPRPVDGTQGLTPPFIPGVTPNFYEHFSAKWLHGGLPFSGTNQRQAVIEVSMLDPGPVTESHILAIADFVPPIALSQLKKPTPGSSISWLLEFMDTPLKELSLEKWRIDVELHAAIGAYTSQSVAVWGPHGEPIALSHQSMVIFG